MCKDEIKRYGGGNLSNNQNDVPFVRNTESSDVYRWQSRSNNMRRFWVVYFLAAFQDSYFSNNLDNDFDPNNEGGTWASANNRPMQSGVLFYNESCRDGGLSQGWRSRISVHELGHNFGLVDLRNAASSDGIMHGVAPVGLPSMNYFWRTEDVNTIRNVVKPK